MSHAINTNRPGPTGLITNAAGVSHADGQLLLVHADITATRVIVRSALVAAGVLANFENAPGRTACGTWARARVSCGSAGCAARRVALARAQSGATATPNCVRITTAQPGASSGPRAAHRDVRCCKRLQSHSYRINNDHACGRAHRGGRCTASAAGCRKARSARRVRAPRGANADVIAAAVTIAYPRAKASRCHASGDPGTAVLTQPPRGGALLHTTRSKDLTARPRQT